MIPGIVASEWRSRNLSVPVLGDVAFLSTWDGTSGGTDAIDESEINAPLTFSSAQLSNVQHLFDATCSLRCDSTIDFVRAPANAAYDIGQGDFTVETFINVPNFGTVGAAQWVGVWQNDEDNTFNQWRALSDSVRCFFQAKIGGAILQFSFVHSMLANSWYYFAWCRYMGRLRSFQGEPGGMASLRSSGNLLSSFDAVSAPLYIGGNQGGATLKSGANAFFQHMRVSRAAWYRDDNAFAVPVHKFGYGMLAPRLLVDADAIYSPSTAFAIFRPPLLADADVFPAPVVAHTPGFRNTITSGGISAGVTSGGPGALPASRVNGNLLIAWINVAAGSKTFSVGGGWTIADNSTDANTSTCWAWRIVDGSEVPPLFSWTGGAGYMSGIYQFTGNHPTAPIGNKLSAVGASANLIVNGGVGLTTSGTMSLVFEISLVTSSAQTIPVPAGYTDTGPGFVANAQGSDRAGYQAVAAAGAVSSPVNLTISSAFWHGFLIEILKS